MAAGNSRLTFDRLLGEEVVRLHFNARWETRYSLNHKRQILRNQATWEVRHCRSKSGYHMSISGPNINKKCVLQRFVETLNETLVDWVDALDTAKFLGHPSRPVSCLWPSHSLALKQIFHTALCQGHRTRVAWLYLVDRLGFESHFGQVERGWRRKFYVRNQH